MVGLVLASLFLLLSHFLMASTPLRAMFVKALGFWGAGLFSIAHVVMRVTGFRQRRLPRHCRRFHPRRQKGASAWNGMGRVRSSDLSPSFRGASS